MKRRSFLTTALAGLSGGQVHAAGLDWPAADPRSAGFDSARLDAARENLAARKTSGVLILRDGRKILEWYAPGADAQTKHFTASMAKALVGGVSLMVAMDAGRIRAIDRAAKFIPGWAGDPQKSKITIRHLATHTSGIQDSSHKGYKHGEEPGWQGQFWRREPDPFSVSIHDAPVIFEPGTSFEYSNPGMAALAYAITASLRGAPQADIRAALRDRVLLPIGVADEDWSIGYGKPTRIDGLDLYATWGGAAFTPRATARVGEWMLHSGRWGGQAQVREAVVRQAVHYSGMPLPSRSRGPFDPGSGLCWYTNFDSVWPAVPRDAFAGAGAQHQVLLVVPSLQLIVVRNGGALTAGDGEGEFWGAVYQHLFEPLMAAMDYPARPPANPYPKSTAIRGVSFAPEIVRRAIDSDNWPLTWGDDDSIYTSYGDGVGFEPFVDRKLSMGFAKVDGGIADFRGSNIRSATGETTGDGKGGAKASGILMVNGVLYLWARNTGNAQLMWSADRARTWQRGFKLEESFGSPAFLNFGRDYAGAPDDFVYAYSQDGGSAYEIDDGIVLARARRDRLKDRASWEFCSGADGGQVRWSRAIGERQPIFRFAQHCQRVDAIYHPILKRYLLVVGYGHTGGWGIYEAPRPWGPWSVAFHTEYWGLGETHGYRIPAKWISADGHDLGLVFSGLIFNGVIYDAFCVRRMKFDF